MRARALCIVGMFAASMACASDPDDKARDDYLLNCMGCHAEDGRGLEGKVPSFVDDLPRLLATPRGRGYIQRVPGVTQSELPSDRLAAVLNWIVKAYAPSVLKTEQKAFTTEEVETMRERPLLEVANERGQL